MTDLLSLLYYKSDIIKHYIQVIIHPVPPKGIEPLVYRLEGGCFIR